MAHRYEKTADMVKQQLYVRARILDASQCDADQRTSYKHERTTVKAAQQQEIGELPHISAQRVN